MTERAAVADDQLDDLLDETRANFQRTLRGRAILIGGVAVSVALFWWIASLFSIPGDRGFSISLMQQPHPVIALFVLLVVLGVVMLIARTMTRSIRPEAGLACAGLGLASVSLRGGPMQTVLFAASGAEVFMHLAVEVAILYGFLLLTSETVAKLERGESAIEPMALDDQLLAVFAHAAAMTVLLMLFCRSDAKFQALISVGLCAAAASFIARQIVNMKALGWLWLSPLIVALFGYIAAWFHPATIQIGILHGPFAPLARPLPLDFAGMGTAGTIVGFWLGGGENEIEIEDES